MNTGCLKIFKKARGFDHENKFIPPEQRASDIQLFRGRVGMGTYSLSLFLSLGLSPYSSLSLSLFLSLALIPYSSLSLSFSPFHFLSFSLPLYISTWFLYKMVSDMTSGPDVRKCHKTFQPLTIRTELA